LWLSEMFLKRDVEWFRTRHPAVHAVVRFDFGDKKIELPTVAGLFDLPGIDTKNLGDVIQLNYQLTGLLPFNGGSVEILAGLLAMTGADYLEQSIKTLGQFSSLLAVPQLSAVLNVAGPIA